MQEMTLKETTKLIELTAMRQPSVNNVCRNDIFRLSARPDAKYAVFGWTQGQHSGSTDSDLMKYSFTFFYVDRLKADKSNEIEIQSTGVETLTNIIKSLGEKGIYADTYSFNTFNQRFTDECAGVFASVNLDVPIDLVCEEYYGADFNIDYNEDYAI